MLARDELGTYLKQYLQCDKFDDYAPNGLQIEGRFDIARICTAVTASKDVVLKAQIHGADALLVHHGYFWKGESPPIVGTKYQRIRTLIQHEINLFAYHLPLDCHPDVGNNACLARLFGATNLSMHKAGRVFDLLWQGEFSEACSVHALTARLRSILQRDPVCLVADNPHPIRRIAWCSGAAQDFIEEASALGVDAYISGEISERTYYQAKELGIHYFSCGHHATERYGIQALGEHLAQTFELEHIFIDSDNPV